MEKEVKNKIKVCFFSPASYHFFYENKQKPFGGAELQMFLLSNFISKGKKFDVSFLVADHKQKKIDKYKNITLIRSIGFNKEETFFKKIQDIIKIFFLLKKHKPNIIITTTANTIIGVISYYSKILKIKHLHRTAHQKDVDGSWIKTNGIKGKIYKYGLKNADVITTQSSDYQKLLQTTHKLKSEVLKNGFSIKPIKTSDKKEILWVSRFQKWKNPELFIKLASNFKDEHFTMICPFNKKDKKEWLELKQKAEKTGNITFKERVQFNEIQDYFNSAKLFVNTSDAEGFPNTFLQAAQAKTPIISLNVNPDNFIIKYNCGVFCKNDFTKLITETKNLLNNKNLLEKKGQNNYAYLAKNHDINLVGNHLQKIILSV